MNRGNPLKARVEDLIKNGDRREGTDSMLLSTVAIFPVLVPPNRIPLCIVLAQYHVYFAPGPPRVTHMFGRRTEIGRKEVANRGKMTVD